MERSQELHQPSPDLSSDFAFGFDDPAFSDRILKLLILDDMLGEKSKDVSALNPKLSDLLRSLKHWKEEISESPKEYSRVKSLNICSLILAAKSPFFRKLFTNGMKASSQYEVTLHIHSSEETALVDIIKFMYDKNSLSASTPNSLMEVLFAADKYDVPSCVNYCCTLLLSSPMTAELALFYIDLPSIISMDAIQPLFNAAQDFLPFILKDIAKYHEDIINLSFDGIKLVLSRDDLKVDSEDEAYALLVQWSKEHFQNREERCRVVMDELFSLIRFQYMTPDKLKCIVDEFSDNNQQGIISSMIGAILEDKKVSIPRQRRAYNLFPVVTVTFEIPHRQCVTYLDLKREDCRDIEKLQSQDFSLDGNIFYLSVQHNKHETSGGTFGLYLWVKEFGKKSVKVNSLLKTSFYVTRNIIT